MTIPSKITPFASDTNYPPGSDPWAGHPTKIDTATRSRGFVPRTKIPSQVHNAEIYRAQAGAEAIRKAALYQALTTGRCLNSAQISNTSTDILAASCFQQNGSVLHLVAPTGGGSSRFLYRNYPSAAAYASTQDRIASYVASVNYETMISFQDSGSDYLVFAGSLGLISAFKSDGSTPIGRADHVTWSVVPRLFGFNGGNSLTPLVFSVDHVLTAGGPSAVGDYIVTILDGGTNTVCTLPAGMTGASSLPAYLERNALGGELWLAAGNKVAKFNGVSTFTLQESGITAGYIVRGLVWHEESGKFLLFTTNAAQTIWYFYSRVPGASSWTAEGSESTTASFNTLFNFSKFILHDVVDFGGILVGVHSDDANGQGLYYISASEDAGHSWSIVAQVTLISTYNTYSRPRMAKHPSGGILCYLPSPCAATPVANPVWISGNPGGLGLDQYYGI